MKSVSTIGLDIHKAQTSIWSKFWGKKLVIIDLGYYGGVIIVCYGSANYFTGEGNSKRLEFMS